jgi:hypothetical protein
LEVDLADIDVLARRDTTESEDHGRPMAFSGV